VSYPSGGSQPSYRPQHGYPPSTGGEPQPTDPYQGWNEAPYGERQAEYPRQVFPQQPSVSPVSPSPTAEAGGSWIDQPPRREREPEPRSWDDSAWGEPRRTRKGLKITLAAVGVVVVLAVVAGFIFGKPILDEYPAKVAAGPSIAGFDQSTNPELVSLSQQMNTEFKAGSELDSTAVGVYHKSGDEEQKVIMVVAGSALLLRPQTELRNAFASMSSGGLTVTSTHSVNPGDLGGYAQCGTSVTGGVKLAVCGWADHGSLGMIMFFDRGVAEAEKLLPDFRQEIETH
jgi:hypothetical protein